MAKLADLIEIQKYANSGWVDTRMAFLREGDIVRSRERDSLDWKVNVVTADAYWSEEFQSHIAQVQEYKLKEDFEFVDDMTRVVLKK